MAAKRFRAVENFSRACSGGYWERYAKARRTGSAWWKESSAIAPDSKWWIRSWLVILGWSWENSELGEASIEIEAAGLSPADSSLDFAQGRLGGCPHIFL